VTLVVTIIESVTRAAISIAEGAVSSRGGVFIKISVLVTREVGLVDLMIIVGESELVITLRPVIAGAEDTTRMEIGPLVSSG